MMGGGGNSISVPVNLKLEVLQSSLTQLQNLLNKLTPNSKGFKDLQNIVSSITGNMEKLSAQTSKPFINQAQFSQAEKTIENIEEGFSRAQLIANRIEFSDLKLDSSQMAAIESFNQQIEQLKANFESLKETEKIKLLGDVDFSGLKDIMNPNTLTGNFDEVIKQITKKSKELENAYFSAQQNLENLEKSRDLGQAAEKIQSGFTDKKGNILPDFEQYFRKLSTSGGIGFKSGQKTAFKEYLIKTFSLDKTEVEELFKKTASEIQAELANPDGLLANAIKTGADARAKLPDARRKVSEAKANADIGQQGLEAAARAQEEVANGAERMHEKTEQVTQGLRGVQQAAVDAARAEGNLGSSQDQLTNQFAQFRQELANASNGMAKAQSQMNTFNGIKNAVVNFLGFNQVLNITRNAIRNAINHIKELDTTMNGIAIVTNMTTADLWNQVEAYSAMAQNFGVTIQGAYEVSKIYYQAGYETNEVLTLTNETLKLSKISGLDYATTTDYMMTAMRGFKLEMEDASRVVDVYSNLAANTAVSQQELAEAMTRTASSLQSVGATFEESSAMIATMVAVTRESANNIGSALKSIASRYGELKSDPTKLFDAEGEAMDFNKVDTALKSVGISLQTTDHQFRDFTDVIVELAGKWDTLDSAQQRYIATQFAGNRQQSRFLALVSNIDLLQENIANAQNSEDIGTLQAMKALDSLESKINQVQVAYQQFYTTIGIEDAWKGFLDITKNVIDNLNNLPKVFGKIPAAAVIVIMNLITLVRTLLHSLMADLATIWEATLRQAQQAAETGGESTGKGWINRLIQSILAEKGRVKQAQEEVVNNNGANQNPNLVPTSRNIKFNKAAGVLNGLSAGLTTVSMLLDQTTEKGRKMSGVLMGAGGAIKGITGALRFAAGDYAGGIMAILSGVAEVFSAIEIIQEDAYEKAERLKKEAEEASNEAKKLKAETNTLDNGIKKLQQLEETRHTSTEAAEEYKTAVDELAESFPALVSGFDDAGNAIIDIQEAEKYLAIQRELTARATYNAADAERKAAQQEEENKKNEAQQSAILSASDMRERRAKFLTEANVNTFQAYRSTQAYFESDDSYLKHLNNLLKGYEESYKDIASAEKAIMKHFKYNDTEIPDFVEEEIEFWDLVSQLDDQGEDREKGVGLAAEALRKVRSLQSKITDDQKNKKWFKDIEERAKELEEFIQDQQASKLSSFAARNKEKKAIADYQTIFTYINSGFENIFAQGLAQLHPDYKWDSKQVSSFYDVFYDFENSVWEKLDKDQRKELQALVNDSYHYSAKDITEKIKRLGITNLSNKIIDIITNSYSETNIVLQSDLKQLLKTSNNKVDKNLYNELQEKVDDSGYEFTEFERRFYNQLFEVSGLYTSAGLDSPQFAGLYDKISQLPIALQDQIFSNGFKTVEGLNKTIETIKEVVPEFDVKPFENIRDALVNNLQLSISSLLNSFTSGVADINKTISNMTSGMEIDDALKLIQSAEKIKFDLSLDDFTVVNGKLVTTATKAQGYWEAYIQDAKKQEEELSKQVQKLSEIKSNKQFSKDERELIASVTGIKDIGNYLNEDGKVILAKKTEFYEALEKAYENASKDLNSLGASLDWATQMLLDSANWKQGNYSDEFGDLKELAQNNNLDKETQARAIEAKKYINESYSTLISDVLSKGFENINTKNYDGLIDTPVFTGSYQQFVHDYSDYTGQTVEEINALLLEAIEKDNKLALNDVITKINFYSKDVAYAELSTVKELADQLGIKDFTKLLTGNFNEQGLAELDLGEDSVLAASAEYKDAIAAKATAIYDIIYTSLNNIIKDITSEGMTKNDAGIFAEEIKKLPGLADVLVEFKNTPTGFKLTEQSVYNIYETLKATGNLQAEILQRDLVGRISKETTIYELDKKIAEIQSKITEETNETNKALRGQLDILKDVRDSKILEEDSSWSFLNDSILGVQNNALKFGDEISKAYGLIDKSIKDSYMSATDFMELVTLFSEKAATTEGGIQFLGRTFTGAAGEIMGVVQELSKVGALVTDATGKGFIVDFKAAAGAFDVGKDALISGVDGYKNAMIDSATEVIKGQIEFLRPFAELEKLSVEGGVGDFSKFFEVQETGLVEATDDFAKAFLKQSDIVKKFKEQFGEDFDLLATFQGFDEKKAQIFVQAALDYKDEATEENLARLFAATKGELDNEVNPVITTTIKTEYDSVSDLVQRLLDGENVATELTLEIGNLTDAKKLQEILDTISKAEIDEQVKAGIQQTINTRLAELQAQVDEEVARSAAAAAEAEKRLMAAKQALNEADKQVAKLKKELATLEATSKKQDEDAAKRIAEVQAELDAAKEVQEAARSEYIAALSDVSSIVEKSKDVQDQTTNEFSSIVDTAVDSINQAIQNAISLVNNEELAASAALETATANAIAKLQAFIEAAKKQDKVDFKWRGQTQQSSETYGPPLPPGLSLVSIPLRLQTPGAPPIIGTTGQPNDQSNNNNSNNNNTNNNGNNNSSSNNNSNNKAGNKEPRQRMDTSERSALEKGGNYGLDKLFRRLRDTGYIDQNTKFQDVSEEFILNKMSEMQKDIAEQKITSPTGENLLHNTGLELAWVQYHDAVVEKNNAQKNGLDINSSEYQQLLKNVEIAKGVVDFYTDNHVKQTFEEVNREITKLYSGISEAGNEIIDTFEEPKEVINEPSEVSDADIEALNALIAKTSEQYRITQENGTTTAKTEELSEAVGAIDITAIKTSEAYDSALQTVEEFKASMETTSTDTEIVAQKVIELGNSSEDVRNTLRDLKNGTINQKQATTLLDSAMRTASAGITSFISFEDVVKEIASRLSSVEFSTSGTGSAKGNVALAKGTQTLMGELGPELYVTGGRYYVAGQNGAEFVDLPNDAIVFNHLQTQRLLSGGSTGRGKPITNAKNATAYATGNVTGPAQASASATIQKLEGYLALFESLKNTSAQDLANAGGGGGGGDDDKQLKNVTAEIQRWYNLLRQIDKLEKDISYQEQLRAKIESDRVVNGRAMYSTYKEELKYLDQEIARNKELANLQKSWYDHKREELANSAYGKIFTYDENGLQQYVGDSRPGSGLGLDILENLTKMKVTGEAVGAAKNVKTQLDYLQSVGFDIEALKFNKDGTTIDTKKLKGDKLDEAYVQMMQNFWDSVDGWRDELDGIYDSYHEQLENVISNEEKRNGLLQEIIDNQLSVEQSVYKAIEEREQAAIDRAQDERDALSDSADKFLDGLSEQLDKERNMYDRNQSSEELNKLRRQLAILQRSGGSASQIRELQNQITSQEQDAYFQAQQDQIDAIKEASDAQLERLDHQIDIMTETLEYQKEHGLLWKEVYDVMAGTPEQIQQFIQENTPDFQSNSALQVMEDLRKLKGEIELWISSRDDSDNPIYTDAGHNWSSYVEASQNRYKDILTDELLAQAKAAFDAEYVRSSDPNAAGAAADAILNKKLEEYNRAHAPANATGNDTANTINNGKNGSGKYWNIRYPDGGQAGKRFGSKQEAEAWKKQMVGLYESIYKDNLSDSTADAETVKKAKADFEKWKNSTIFSYSHGGLANYTGLAMVHGSKTKPEAFFNAEQTAMWKNDILGKHNSLTSLLLDFTSALGDLADSNTYNTINRGEAINIDKAEVIMNVGSIANDYDARRAGESALEEMLNIARKTGTRGVSRR